MADDIVDRLRFWCELPKGAPLPDGDRVNTWDGLIRAVCANAIAEIESLRHETKSLRLILGAVSIEPSGLRDIKDKVGG